MNIYKEVYHGEDFTEENFYDAVRYVFGAEVAGASTEEIDSFLMEQVSQMTTEEAENFWQKIGGFAKKIASGALKVVKTVAPIAGTVVGGMYGMPQLGAAAGGMLGNLAGAGSQALNRGGRRGNRGIAQPNPIRTQLTQVGQYAKGVGQAALNAANQYAINNPYPVPAPENPLLSANSAKILSAILENPQFQALLFGKGFSSGNSESFDDSDADFIDMVEAVNYLTENIIADYYESGLVEDDEYYVDEYGELVVNFPEDRVERIESYLETLV